MRQIAEMALENILKEIKDVRVIDAAIPYKAYMRLDLSVSNTEKPDAANAAQFERYIEKQLAQQQAQVAFGGYKERRDLYKRSGIFNSGNEPDRDIHIGLDLWTKAGTAVLAALDGNVHSFGFNTGLGNYGPTIILEHQIASHRFYTLYGHLSSESIADLRTGQQFAKGDRIGSLGDATVNGDYAPHLHFQLIEEISDYFGDYPGVCTEADLDFYEKNCPDPNLLLKIEQP